MRALLQTEFGGHEVLRLDEIATPQPGDEEVLVRVHAASLNFADKMTLLGQPYLFRPFAFGFKRPRNPVAGLSVAGVVESVGAQVTRFHPGDEVFAELPKGWACAEYVAAAQDVLALKPESVSFEQAATIAIAGTTALEALREVGAVREGSALLINGASGGVGTFAIQIGKALGAQVTAVCSPHSLEQARALGADRVIDYTAEDFTNQSDRYDVLFDLVGNHPLPRCRQVLEPRGVYIASFGQGGGEWLGPLARIFRVAVASIFRPATVRVFAATPSPDHLVDVARMVADGQVRPVIEQTYPLSESQQAFQHLLRGHLQGKLVIAPVAKHG
jgi:NADPH:quinone reductase-like Zn-dependent oxidoreductase